MLKQLVRPYEDVFIPGLRSDKIGIQQTVGVLVRAGFSLLAKPEADSIRGGLTRFVCREAVGSNERITEGEDREKTFDGVVLEQHRGVGFNVLIAVRGVHGVLDAVHVLAGLGYPMPRSVEVAPYSVVIALKVIER